MRRKMSEMNGQEGHFSSRKLILMRKQARMFFQKIFYRKSSREASRGMRVREVGIALIGFS
jgi:hypothetical protein